jgi:hypothetical protein
MGAAGIGGPKTDLNKSLDRMVTIFGLRHLLTREHPILHTHRFRKTLARILALSLSSAQVVLMDCFGHDDPDVTLGYMLSDKAIVADALRIQRELVIVMARDAIHGADELGGPMATVVRAARQRFIQIKKTNLLSPSDEFELADQLTLGGQQWVFVMEGVICTLSGLDSGPCGEGKGVRRDPLNCQAGCPSQLILAYHKNHANDMIAYLLPLLQRAVDEGAEGLVAQLSAQLRNHLYRWSDVYKRWVEHPLIAAQCVTGDSPWWEKELK